MILPKGMSKQTSAPRGLMAQWFGFSKQETRPMNERETSLWRGQTIGFTPTRK